VKRASLVLGTIALLSSREALAQDDAPPPSSVTIQVAQPPSDTPPAAPAPAPSNAWRTDLWKISVGPRFNYVTSAGFDPYATNDVLTRVAVEGQYPVYSRGNLALGVGLGYAGGGRTGKMRGAETGLGVHSFSVPIEGRYHLGRWAYGFLHVAPGATALLSSVQDASAPNQIESTRWAFTTDLSAGAAILMGPRAPDDKRTVRFWLIPEFGYTLATTASFDARPDRDPKDALGTDERTALRDLNLGSFFWKLSLSTTF
jgi:hypothetical protein